MLGLIEFHGCFHFFEQLHVKFLRPNLSLTGRRSLRFNRFKKKVDKKINGAVNFKHRADPTASKLIGKIEVLRRVYRGRGGAVVKLLSFQYQDRFRQEPVVGQFAPQAQITASQRATND